MQEWLDDDDDDILIYFTHNEGKSVIVRRFIKALKGNIDKKIPNTSGLVTKTVLNTKISEVKNKIPDHVTYITTPEFNKLTAENFAARMKQANSVSKTDSDNELIAFNRKITLI